MLCPHAAKLPTRVDEDGLEVGRLAALHRAAELFRDVLSCFLWHGLGEMAAEQLRPREAYGPLRSRVQVHEPAVNVVQARGHHEAVDQGQVDILQTRWHRAHMLDQPFSMRQQRDAHCLSPNRGSAPLAHLETGSRRQ